MFIVTDDEDPFFSWPGYGRDKLRNLMDKQGTRFENCIGAFSACAPFRATVMLGQQQVNSGIVGNQIWKGLPPAPGTIVDQTDTTQLIFDWTTTIFHALAGTPTNRTVQTAQFGKLINTYNFTVPVHPYFCPLGIDRLHTVADGDETKGGGNYSSKNHSGINVVAGSNTISDPNLANSDATSGRTFCWTDDGSIPVGTWVVSYSNPTVTLSQPAVSSNPSTTVHYTVAGNPWQGWTIINDHAFNPVADGPSAVIDGSLTFPNSYLNSQNVHDWIADRIDDTITEFTTRDRSDPRYGLPFFLWVAPPTPHPPALPLGSQGNGISAATKADRQNREGFYADPSWIPPHFDYRRLYVAATGGTFKITFAGNQTGALAYNISASALQTALNGIGVGSVTVSGGPGDADGTSPYVIDFPGNGPPNPIQVMTLDVTQLNGRAFTAFPDIDQNDPGNPGVINAIQTSLQACVALDDMVERIINKLTSAGLIDNTIIIYTSDNGTYTGTQEHYRQAGKGDCYAGDLRIPLMVRGPGIPKNVLNNAPVLNVQFTDYILKKFGATSLVTADDVTFDNVLYNDQAAANRVFHIQGEGEQGVQVGYRWKYWNWTSNNSQSQEIFLAGATGGTFKLTFQQQNITITSLKPSQTITKLTTNPIAWNATAATVQAELVALLGSGNVTVTLSGTTYKVTFAGTLANKQLLPLLADSSALVGKAATVSIFGNGAQPPTNLYRIDVDPFETMNLAGMSAVATVQSDLNGYVTALQSAAGSTYYQGTYSTYTG